MEQRARWFGYKNAYLDVCKVYTTKRIKEIFESILEHDDDMWELIERNKLMGIPFKEMPRIFKLKNQVFLRMTRGNVKKTESFTLSPWKTQRYISCSESDAGNNRAIIEAFRQQYKEKESVMACTPSQVHTLFENIAFSSVFNSILSNLKWNSKEVADITFWRQLNEAFAKAHIDPVVDVLILRDGVWQTRTVSSDGAINQLFQGYSPNTRSAQYYVGDKALAKRNPNRLQLQIHYVKPRNDDSINYYSPVVALSIPETISKMLSDLVVPSHA